MRIIRALESGVIEFPPGLNGKQRKNFIKQQLLEREKQMGHVKTSLSWNGSLDWNEAPSGATHLVKSRPWPWMMFEDNRWWFFREGEWEIQCGVFPCPSDTLEERPKQMNLHPVGTQTYIQLADGLFRCEVIAHFQPNAQQDSDYATSVIVDRDGIRSVHTGFDLVFVENGAEILEHQSFIKRLNDVLYGIDPLDTRKWMNALYLAGLRFQD